MLRSFIGVSAFFLAACGPGLCVNDSCTGPLSVLSSSVDFGLRGAGTLNTYNLLLTNSSENSISGLSGTVTSPFGFLGGVFPGTGGTCTSDLGGGQSCTVVLMYQPPSYPAVGTYAGTLTLNYSGSGGSQSLVVTLTGESDNGTFVIGQGFNGTVSQIIRTTEGVYAVGAFIAYKDRAIVGVARVHNDGTLDTAFNPGTSTTGAVDIVAANDGSGDVYIGGNFTSFNGTAINHVARINSNGSLDTGFNPGTSCTGGSGCTSLALAADGTGLLYLGGNFTGYNGFGLNRLVRITATGARDASFTVGGFDAVVQDLDTMTDGRLYAAGQFTTYGGTARSGIVRLLSDGAVDTTFAPGTGFTTPNEKVVAQDGSGKIYVGGFAANYNGNASPYVARILADGTFDPTFAVGAGFSSTVDSVIPTVDGTGDVYIGGPFTSYRGTTTRGLIRLSNDGTPATSFAPSVAFSPPPYTVRPVVFDSDSLVVGGSFRSYNGTGVNRLARVKHDGTLDTAFNSRSGFVSTSVQTMAVPTLGNAAGKIYTAGAYALYDGTSRANLARLNVDGSLDTTFTIGTGLNSVTYDVRVAADGTDDLFVGGQFATYNGTASAGIARLNSDGQYHSSFAVQGFTGGNVMSMIPWSDGGVVAFGSFTAYGGTGASRVARLLATGALDTSFGGTGFATSLVYAAAKAADGSGDIIVGGDFANYRGSAGTVRVARLRSDGSHNPSLSVTVCNSNVLTVGPLADGDIYLGGSFTFFQGTLLSQIVRINPDGSVDPAFNIGTGFNGSVSDIFVLPDGSGDILVGGFFTTYNGTSTPGLARLHSDGSVDTRFTTGANSNVNRLLPANDGTTDVYVAGNFTVIGNKVRDFIARITPLGEVD